MEPSHSQSVSKDGPCVGRSDGPGCGLSLGRCHCRSADLQRRGMALEDNGRRCLRLGWERLRSLDCRYRYWFHNISYANYILGFYGSPSLLFPIVRSARRSDEASICLISMGFKRLPVGPHHGSRLGYAFSSRTSQLWVMSATAPSMMDAEQYLSLESSMARSTLAGARLRPLTRYST